MTHPSGREKLGFVEGRSNWLGEQVRDLVRPTDHVLDLGCGVLMPLGGRRLKVATHLAVDAFAPYLEYLKGSGPVLHAQLPNCLSLFPDGSYDVVLLLDVVEHLDKADAIVVVSAARYIARRMVIVFTPDGFKEQNNPDAWGFEGNDLQEHLCGFTQQEMRELGYQTRIQRKGIFATAPEASHG